MTAARHISPNRGFTFLEVLLAVAVFAIVLASLHGVFYGGLRLRNKTTLALERTVPLQHSLAIIKRDLANLVVPGGTLFGPLQTTPTTGTAQGQTTPTTGTAQGQTSPSLASSSSLLTRGLVVSPALYTAVGILEENMPWAEVEKVTYFLADPTNQTVGRDLFRSVTRNLLPTLQEEPTDQWLMSGVQEVIFSYFDGNQWLETWDSTTQPTPLPQAIKVEVLLAAEDPAQPLREPITLVVPVLVQGRTNQTAQTTGGGQ